MVFSICLYLSSLTNSGAKLDFSTSSALAGVFSELGIQVNSPEARNRFLGAGAEADGNGKVVKVPQGLVEDLIHKAPSVVHLCGREENGHSLPHQEALA